MHYKHLPDVGAYGLPELDELLTPNRSTRAGVKANHVWIHVWGGGTYPGVVSWLRNPDADASSHVVYAGEIGPHAGAATQLVPWAEKAWTEGRAFNPHGLSIESADAIWQGHDPEGFARLARIAAYLHHAHEIPAVWVRGEDLLHMKPGLSRHGDGGALAGGHPLCPTADLELWRSFGKRVEAELAHGGFRPSWGR